MREVVGTRADDLVREPDRRLEVHVAEHWQAGDVEGAEPVGDGVPVFKQLPQGAACVLGQRADDAVGLPQTDGGLSPSAR